LDLGLAVGLRFGFRLWVSVLGFSFGFGLRLGFLAMLKEPHANPSVSSLLLGQSNQLDSYNVKITPTVRLPLMA